MRHIDSTAQCAQPGSCSMVISTYMLSGWQMHGLLQARRCVHVGIAIGFLPASPHGLSSRPSLCPSRLTASPDESCPILQASA